MPSKSSEDARSRAFAAWSDALRVIWKHWRLALAFASSVVAAAAIVTFAMTPEYAPEATIELDPPGNEMFALQAGAQLPNDQEYLETQSKKLGTDALALSVIRELHLDQNPEFLVAPFGKRALGHVARVFRPKKRSAATQGQSGAPVLTPAEAKALSNFAMRRNVDRDTSSRLITVSVYSADPQLAARITNKLVKNFIQQSHETRHQAIMDSTQWLTKQLEDVRERMDAATQALTAFQKESGIAEVETDKNTIAQQISQQNQQLTQSQADRIQLQALLGSHKEIVPDSLPQVLLNPVVQDLTKRSAEVHAGLAESKVTYGRNHPAVRKLQEQSDEIDAQLKHQRDAIVAQVKASYAAAQARERLMTGQIEDSTKKVNALARYNALRREAETDTDLYNKLYQQVKEAGIAAGSKATNVRIVDAGRVLDSPTYPNPLINLGVGLMAGVVGGIGLAFLREGFDNRVQSISDVRTKPGLPGVSLIPKIAGRPNTPKHGSLTAVDPLRLRAGVPTFILDEPDSLESETIRGLQTSVLFSRAGSPPQTLLVASSLPFEGKTTVAANLAIALALQGPVCLIDADARKADLAATFSLSNNRGLTDLLIGTATLDDVLITVPGLMNLTLLPSGSEVPNAGELVCSTRMRDALERLRAKFTFIVIDSAPILPYADARALAPLVDGVIFVGRSGITPRTSFARGIELLQDVRSAPILQFVLNDADSKSPHFRGQYGYKRKSASN